MPARAGALLDHLLAGWYLWVTPLFVLLDVLFGLPLRAAVLPDGGPRVAFYGLLIALGVACHRFPAVASPAALVESAIEVGALMIVSFLAILQAPERLGETPLGLPWLADLLLCASVGVLAFQRALLRLRSGPAGQ